MGAKGVLVPLPIVGAAIDAVAADLACGARGVSVAAAMSDGPNALYYGDNLDPPFNSNAVYYNVLFAEQDGSRAAAQIEAF